MTNMQVYAKGKKHNKKRNTGLVYEFLITKAATAVLNEDYKTAKTAIKLIKKHFKKGTELYREWRLFNALIKENVTTETIANKVLTVSKESAQAYNRDKLEKEKAILIKRINESLNNNNNFFNEKVENYTLYATVQTLLNEWRNNFDPDIIRLAEYEDKLVSWLCNKNRQNTKLKKESTVINDPLVIKLMLQKINERYNDKLSTKQKNLINLYLFEKNNNFDNLKTHLNEERELLLKALLEYKTTQKENHIIYEKITSAVDVINKLDTNNINDQLIIKFMKLYELKKELI